MKATTIVMILFKATIILFITALILFIRAEGRFINTETETIQIKPCYFMYSGDHGFLKIQVEPEQCSGTNTSFDYNCDNNEIFQNYNCKWYASDRTCFCLD